jgi:hypothetical protein
MIDEVTRRMAIKNLEAVLSTVHLAAGEEPARVVCADGLCHATPLTLEEILELMKTNPGLVEDHIRIWAKYGGRRK